MARLELQTVRVLEIPHLPGVAINAGAHVHVHPLIANSGGIVRQALISLLALQLFAVVLVVLEELILRCRARLMYTFPGELDR